MTLATLSTNKLDAAEVYAELTQLQLEQFQHDETYHREIARLCVQDRLRHMALHFAKYAGNLAENGSDDAHVKRIVTDVFVIGTSTANTLNVSLADALAGRMMGAGNLEQFAICLTVSAGRMAAACEKLDHLEDFPFRPVIRDAALDLVESAICFASSRNWNLEEMVRRRLKGVKEKWIHHGKI